MRTEFTRAQARKTCIGSNRMVVMLGPSEASLGGIAAVIEVYRQQGLFGRWSISFIETYRDGAAFDKAWASV